MTEQKIENKEPLSRLGRKPIPLPEGTKVTFGQNGNVVVEGKRGKLNWALPKLVEAKADGKEVVVSVKEENPKTKALHGLSRKILLNMVEGVSKGFEKRVVIEGVGYRANVAGDKLNMTLGFSHPVAFQIPKDIKIKLEGKGQNILVVEGNDKQKVGEIAAKIRSIRPPEPYKGTGIRYETEVVKRKPGKAAVGAAGGGKK